MNGAEAPAGRKGSGPNRPPAAAARLPASAVALMLLLCVVWGGNMAAIKIGAESVAPVFSAFLRSAVAAACLAACMRVRAIPLFPDRLTVLHGAAAGLLFGAEFGCVYLGLKYTLASRAYVLLYTSPFFVALGGHFLLHDDRLSASKGLGLVLAFSGVVLLFARDWGEVTLRTLPGDLLLLGGGAFWGATTLYIKRYLPGRARPVQTLFYQLLFSAPLLLVLSFALGGPLWSGFTWRSTAAILYQSLVVAFVSYLLWFQLLHRHPASLLTAFTFLTPVVGVALSGLLILGEPASGTLLASLVLVTAGLFVVHPPRAG